MMWKTRTGLAAAVVAAACAVSLAATGGVGLMADAPASGEASASQSTQVSAEGAPTWWFIPIDPFFDFGTPIIEKHRKVYRA